MAKIRAIEEQKLRGQVNNEKGQALEDEFARFMMQELKWEKCWNRLNITRGGNLDPKQADIIARRPSEFGLKMKRWTKVYFASWLSLVLVGLTEAFIFQDRFTGFGLIIMSIIYIIAGAVAFPLSLIYNIEHARVECKDIQDSANINLIHELLGDHELYNKSGDKTYKFKQLYFVSVNGFTDSALRLATLNKIKCYVKDKSGNFVELIDELG